jgi:hypothetical protein
LGYVGWNVELWTFEELRKIVQEFKNLKSGSNLTNQTANLMDQQYYSPAGSEGVSIDSIDRKDSADQSSNNTSLNSISKPENEAQKKPSINRPLNKERFVPSKETQNQSSKNALDRMFADLDSLKFTDFNTPPQQVIPAQPHEIPPQTANFSLVAQLPEPVSQPGEPSAQPPRNGGSSFEINEKGEIVFINPIPELIAPNSIAPTRDPNQGTKNNVNGNLAFSDDDFFLLLAHNPTIPSTSGAGLSQVGQPKSVLPPKIITSQPSSQAQKSQPTTTITTTPGLPTPQKTLVLQQAPQANQGKSTSSSQTIPSQQSNNPNASYKPGNTTPGTGKTTSKSSQEPRPPSSSSQPLPSEPSLSVTVTK